MTIGRDKVQHLVANAVLVCILHAAFFIIPLLGHLRWTACIVFLIGIVKELSDLASGWIVGLPWCHPTCQFELLDIAFNVLGILVGVSTVIIVRYGHRCWVKAQLQRRQKRNATAGSADADADGGAHDGGEV